MGGVRIAGAANLADGELRAFQAGGRRWVVIRIGDDRYACENKCPHYGVRLANGHLEGSVLECRWHHWRLDLSNGSIEAPDSPFESFETFDVQVDGVDLIISTTPRTRLRLRPPGSDANEKVESVG